MKDKRASAAARGVVSGGALDRRGFLKLSGFAGMAAAGAGPLLVGCSGSSSAKSGGSASTNLKIADDTLSQNGWSLDPAWELGVEDSIQDCIYEGLTAFKPGTNEIVNLLAESIEVSADKKRIHFKLKQGIEFQGGYGEVTAEDVKYSFERIIGLQKLFPGATGADAKLVSNFGVAWQVLAGVTATGKYEGDIVLKQPFAPILSVVLPGAAGFIVSKKALEERKGDHRQKPIGTGPYEFESQQPNQRIILKRFDKYSGSWHNYVDKHEFDTLEFVNASGVGQPSGELAMQAGEIDVLPFVGSGDTATLSRFVQRKGQFNVTTLDHGAAVYMSTMNIKHPLLRDRRVREAIAAAVDYDAILSVLGNGVLTDRARGALSPILTGYWKDGPLDAHDPEKAKSLLAAAGESSINLGDVPVETGSESTWEALQGMLGKAGVNLKLNQGQLRNDLKFRSDPNRYTMSLWTFSGRLADPHFMLNYFTAKQDYDASGNSFNFSFFYEPAFNDLIKQGAQEYEQAKREQIYIDAQELLRAQLPHLYYAYTKPGAVSKTNIKPVINWDGKKVLVKDTRTTS